MDKLFKVTLDGYQQYYVTAKNFNQAAIKAIEVFEEENRNKILTSDGSLNFQSNQPVVKQIEFLSNKII